MRAAVSPNRSIRCEPSGLVTMSSNPGPDVSRRISQRSCSLARSKTQIMFLPRIGGSATNLQTRVHESELLLHSLSLQDL
jgi:hypothetical protein